MEKKGIDGNEVLINHESKRERGRIRSRGNDESHLAEQNFPSVLNIVRGCELEKVSREKRGRERRSTSKKRDAYD